jgi:F0F1-type ATP synthase delta subunit
MAKIGRRRLAREVVRLLHEQPAQQAQLVQKLAAYLVDTKQTNQADLLIKDIADEFYVQQKHVAADVRHAFDLTPETQSRITDLIKQATGAASVELQATKEPELLGGVVIRTPRQELDASVRQKLKALSAGGNN